MRKITANYVFPLSSKPLKNGIIILDDNNRIINLIDTKGQLKEVQNLEFYGGIIIPGFVDAFCMLSWSTLSTKDFLGCTSGNFIKNLKRKTSGLLPDTNSIQRGINHLEAFGTKGAADFYPTATNENLKAKSKIEFRNVGVENFKFDLKASLNTVDEKDHSPVLINQHTVKFIKNIAKNNSRFCIGTGSLQTHKLLSVFDEMKYLQEKYPQIEFEELLKWGSLNPAKHLRLDSDLGSIEIGKKPGLNLLSGIDFKLQRFTPDSSLKILI